MVSFWKLLLSIGQFDIWCGTIYFSCVCLCPYLCLCHDTQIVSMCHMTGVYLNESIFHDSTAKSNLLYCREHELIYLWPNAILCELNAFRFVFESNRIENQYWNVDFYFSLTQFCLLETNCCLRSSSTSISQKSLFFLIRSEEKRKNSWIMSFNFKCLPSSSCRNDENSIERIKIK